MRFFKEVKSLYTDFKNGGKCPDVYESNGDINVVDLYDVMAE